MSKEEARRPRRVQASFSGWLPQRATTLVPVPAWLRSTSPHHSHNTLRSQQQRHPPRSTQASLLLQLAASLYSRPHEILPRPTARTQYPAMLYSALVTATLAACALAAPKITSPAAGASIPVGGGAITVEWEDDGKAPKMSQLSSFTLQLIVGGNTEANSVSGRT